MISRTTKIAAEVVAGVLAVFVLLTGIALWRLWTGPVELDFLTPRIEQALADPESGLTIQVGTTVLTWGGWARTIDLHARDVRIRDLDGATVAVLPDTIIRLSLRALVQGTVAPTVVELVGTRVRVVRQTDGSFSFGRWEDETLEDTDLSDALPTVIGQLLSAPSPEHPLAFLTAVRIVGGQVWVNDRKLGTFWKAPYAEIELRRAAGGLAGDVTLAIELGDTQAQIAAGFVYDRTTARVDLSADFAELQPEAMVSVVPGLELVGSLTSLLDGTVSASVGLDGSVDSLRVEMTGGPGQMRIVDVAPDGMPVRSFTLIGRVSGPERRFEIETAAIGLGTQAAPGPELSAVGMVTSTAPGFAGDLQIDLEVRATGIDMAGLEAYWPEAVAASARAWVVRNIPAGRADEVMATASLRLPAGRLAGAEIARLDGAMRYHDLEVHYFRPLPPATTVAGTAVFDQDKIVFTPERGTAGALGVGAGSIEIVGMSGPHQRMALDLAVVGPLRDALELLDHDRLALVRGLGIDPAGTSGQMAARLAFRFPLLNALTIDRIEVAAMANLEQVAVAGFLMGKDASEGSLSVEVDRTGMRIKGPVALAGVPVDLVWTEAFGAAAARRTTLEVEVARLGEAGRRRFGLDLAPYLEGPVSASIVATTDRAGRGTLKAAVNLREAALAFEDLYWAKPAGVEGEAFVTLAIRDERLVGLERIEVEAGSLRARGAGGFGEGGKLASLALDELSFNDTRLSRVEVVWQGDGLAVAVGGGRLDAEPFLRTGPVAPQPAAFAPLALSAGKLDSLHFGPGRYVENVELSLRRSGRGWERIALAGELPRALWSPARKPAPAGRERRESLLVRGDDTPAPLDELGPDGQAQAPEEPPPPAPIGPKVLRIRLVPADGGGLALDVLADDMGAALRALDVLDTVHGGHMSIVGRSDGALPGSPLHGRIEAKDYVVVDAPALARLLTVASLTGVSDLLSGEGIQFQRLVGEFTLSDGKIETDLMRAYGSALGLTAKGTVDVDGAGYDLKGTLVPAYSVNRILGEIPLLGPILTGGEGEGFLAVTYKMTGPLDDPLVEVDPLSVLAPGFLRGLFSLGGGDGDQPRALPERVEP